ncbi:hypothetical protein D3H65_10665 [Paraflavitalea soli]|uniref:DUF4738 domain-containing protein n=1 Tax=Paraflavitalea soli TaxID=2315862 RepID=A0A3B7MM76_9BACT|nr:hypothetical protein [Paraflavitalea soli]AXY74409.1 hypothetical protein D3H65_10665 [Paraflavitalea soli]
MKFFSLLLFTLLFTGCVNAPNQASDNLLDSIENSDSVLPVKPVIDTSQEDHELDDIIKKYTLMYDDPIYIDSSYIISKDTFKITMKHYCLRDSAITVPNKYVEVYKLNNFVTHNFNTILTIKKNGVTVTEKNITKSDFENYLEENLRNYGVLLYPEVETMDSTVKINYSISIPLTDIGIGVSVMVDKYGNANFKSSN